MVQRKKIVNKRKQMRNKITMTKENEKNISKKSERRTQRKQRQ